MIRKFKALLDLGRVSNLPTIWSNCLGAWVLAGSAFTYSESMQFHELEGIFGRLAHLFTVPMAAIFAAAASLLYVGGTALNDAFDADYDREHRPERPIPSGAFSAKWVGILGISALAVGAGIFLNLGISTGGIAVPILTISLVALILIYDWMHKKSVWAVIPMGGCRLLLYLLVGMVAVNVTHIFTVSDASFDEMSIDEMSSATMSLNQLIPLLAVGGALFVYIVVLTLSARAESGSEKSKVTSKVSWLLYLPVLASAVVLFLHDASQTQYLVTLIAGTIFVAWTKSAISVLHNQQRGPERIGEAVGRLLAGICLIDCMAVAAVAASPMLAIYCLGFFALALFLQRYVSGT
jgi:4-hydroxybenzoate polyprenyltransferase